MSSNSLSTFEWATPTSVYKEILIPNTAETNERIFSTTQDRGAMSERHLSDEGPLNQFIVNVHNLMNLNNIPRFCLFKDSEPHFGITLQKRSYVSQSETSNGEHDAVCGSALKNETASTEHTV
jgi:hypothetical protein